MPRLRVRGIQVTYDSPRQFAQILDLGRGDDPGMLPANGFPRGIKGEVIAGIEDEDGPPLLCGIHQLGLVGEVLVTPAGFETTDHVITALPQRGSQRRVDILIGE